MSALTFDFPYHITRDKYPEGTSIQLGKGWVYPIKPDSPDQRIFTLTMKGMKYFVVSGVLSNSVTPERNLLRLRQFYEAVQMWDTFTYPHPVLGNVTCRFMQPLDLPDGIEDGDGMVPPFQLVFIEVPA